MMTLLKKIGAGLLFLLSLAASVLSVFLISLGVLAVPVASAVLTGVFTSVASDLAPPSLLLAGIFCVCGGALCAYFVYKLFIAQFKALWVSRNIRRATALALVTLTFLSGAGAVLTQVYVVKRTGSASTVYRDKLYFSVKPSVEVSLSGLPVLITEWDGGDIKIECVAELPLIIEETEQALIVSQDDGFAVSIFTLDVFRYYLTISLPAAIYKNIGVTGAGSDVIIDSVSAKKISVVTKNGTVSVKGADSSLTVKTGTGGINIDFANFFAPAFIETKSGDIMIDMPDYASARLMFYTERGSLTSDFFNRAYDAYKGTVFAVKGDAEDFLYNLYVNTVSGALTVKEKNSDVIGNNPRL